MLANDVSQRLQIAFSVDGKALSMRGNRVLKDASGNTVCAMQAKVTILHYADAWQAHRQKRSS